MDKINIKFNNPIMDQENIEKIAGKTNEVVDKLNDYANGTGGSTKKIYCHPISIDIENDNILAHVAMLIFDNSNTEYNTYTKLRNKLSSIFAINENAVFPITGALYYVSGSQLHIAQKIGFDDPDIKIYTSRPDGTQGNFNIEYYLIDATIYDGVNAIN